jgi:hypothetical protein
MSIVSNMDNEYTNTTKRVVHQDGSVSFEWVHAAAEDVITDEHVKLFELHGRYHKARRESADRKARIALLTEVLEKERAEAVALHERIHDLAQELGY